MKKILFAAPLVFCFCHSQTYKLEPVENIHEFYCQYSDYTDPGRYESLLKSLPDSLSELCEMIKCQFIHPVDLAPYRDLLPPERHYEDPKYPTAEKLVAGLLELDSTGLTLDRKPEDRLVVTCCYHALFLASILKSLNIPTRVRYGFAPYLSRNKDRHVCHVICEVWNEQEKRWMFVDPDRKMVDFPREEFELAGDVWLEYQEGKVEHPDKYGVANVWSEYHILDMLCHDFTSVMGRELLYWERPLISTNTYQKLDDIDKEKQLVLNEISDLMKDPDHNLNRLIEIYNQHRYLQFQ